MINIFSKAKWEIKNWWFCWLVCWWQYLRIECFMSRYNILAIIFHAMPPREKFIDIPRWISLGSCHHCNKTRQRYVHSRHLFCHIIIGEKNIIVCCCYCKNILKFNTYQNYRNLFIVFSHYFTQSNYEKTLLLNSFFNFLFVLKYEIF